MHADELEFDFNIDGGCAWTSGMRGAVAGVPAAACAPAVPLDVEYVFRLEVHADQAEFKFDTERGWAPLSPSAIADDVCLPDQLATYEKRRLAPARIRRRMNNELNFPPNFERLVLGCIDADFCK